MESILLVFRPLGILMWFHQKWAHFSPIFSANFRATTKTKNILKSHRDNVGLRSVIVLYRVAFLRLLQPIPALSTAKCCVSDMPDTYDNMIVKTRILHMIDAQNMNIRHTSGKVSIEWSITDLHYGLTFKLTTLRDEGRFSAVSHSFVFLMTSLFINPAFSSSSSRNGPLILLSSQQCGCAIPKKNGSADPQRNRHMHRVKC